MKTNSLFFMILLPFCCFGQVNDNFADGDFLRNPAWTGTTANFTVNTALQLQSKAPGASTSWLFTPSEALEDAVWECWVKVTYPTSSSNYASVYLVSDRDDLSSGCNGYYVQVGGTNDEVSLYVQEGTKKTKIIDGADKRTDGNPVEVRIKVTRDADGNFTLYSKLPTEKDFVCEGQVQDTRVTKSNCFGLSFCNTGTTGSAYYFDDVLVSGHKAIDREAPRWNTLRLEQPDKLVLGFSEPMDFSKAAYALYPESYSPSSQVVSDDKMSVTLMFDKDFEPGSLYSLKVGGLTDLAGNILPEETRTAGIFEPIAPGDVVLNEIMFENPENSLEYVEIYNRSGKLLDISGLVLATRKTDGSLNGGIKIPPTTFLPSFSYLALCAGSDSVRNYHKCPADSRIVAVEWTSLNNEKASIALSNATKDTIFDELSYSVKWHHPLVKNPKGVALERIHPDLPTQDAASWHSAASEVNYGTPGYRNSQYREMSVTQWPEKNVWLDPEAFSPDNDGVKDVCLIHYRLPANGYTANVIVLTPGGERVCQLAVNQLLAAEGNLTWDGRTAKGALANAGVYVLYFEMFHPQNGDRKQLKLPVVVSFR